LFLVLGLSLTGYLLPWDQKGYWATKVATSIAAITPFVGPELQKLIVGGADYGHHTLTRFFALHAGVLPGSIFVLLAGHIYLFRRHGLTAKEPRRRPDAPFWPDQVLKDVVACLAVLAAVLVLTVVYRGAPLGAPADPAENYAAARPEWYFLFLFELLKYFPGRTEIIGAMILPGAITVLVCLMPFLGKWRLGHRFNVGFLFALLVAVGLLTWRAMHVDRSNPAYVAAVAQADRDARRVVELARGPQGIPSAGAVSLLREDAYTQGPKIFARACASCHRYDGHNALGLPVTASYVAQTNDTVATVAAAHKITEAELRRLNPGLREPLKPEQRVEVPAAPSAAELKDFASRAWIAGFLDPARVSTPQYFGGTKFADGKMARFVKKTVAGYSPEEREQLRKVVIALSAEAGLKSQRAEDARDAALIEEGRKLAANDTMRCTECHLFRGQGEDPTGPDLTGYGSRDWLIGIITDPRHERFYGKRNDRMPAFGPDQTLDAKAIGQVADWLRGEWYEPETPRTASAAK
jgi:ubiquinol-cytochrome c reductase cytochrome b subunit